MENTVLKEKLWILNESCNGAAAHAIAKIARKLCIHPIIAKLLYNRGYTDESSARTFVRMESEMLCNPFQMKDMVRGIERIQKAIERKEKIVVYGDYDVDGVTASFVLSSALQNLGADCAVYIPDRVGEGYGMKAWGNAKFEWNEQAANFAKYVTNKTADQVANIAVTEGKPSDADLASTVTIKIGGFQALIAKAMK